MRYNDLSQQSSTGSIIGNNSDPFAASTVQYPPFWRELASRYVDNEKLIYGTMNEPHDVRSHSLRHPIQSQITAPTRIPTSLVLQNVQAAINGIRASGAKHSILAPGGRAWDKFSRMDAPSANYMVQLVDPMHNTAIDIHEYPDYDFSGRHLI